MTTIQDGKRELKELIRNIGNGMIEQEEDLPVQRIIGTISQRLEDAMNVLDSAEAYSPEEVQAKRKKTIREIVNQILFHPAVPLILAAVAIFFGILTISLGASGGQGNQQIWAVQMILVLALLLAHSIFHLILHNKEKQSTKEPQSAQAGIALLQAKATVTKVAGTMIGDSKAIAGLFSEEKRRADNSFEDDIMNLYCSMYEARIDNPEVKELNYPITLTEMLLRKMGIREVMYSPDKENFFEIRNEDYHDEMRIPALIREESGELLRKGEFIRNINRK